MLLKYKKICQDIQMNNKLPYVDITKKLSKRNRRYKIIMQQFYVDEEGNKYKVDGKLVVLEPTQREIEVGNMLGSLYGGDIKIIPRVNFPKKIKTPDYIIRNEKFDLKEINGNGRYVIEGNLKGKQKQANNFIIDITCSCIDKEDALMQVKEIFISKRYLWINKILLINGKKFIKIFKRKH